MGTALIKMKIMPESPDVKLDEIKGKAKEIISSNNGKNPSFEEDPIAFGLKALIIGFSLDESNELDPIEQALGKLENVSSCQVVDMRRALG